jgi:hypothetical protein
MIPIPYLTSPVLVEAIVQGLQTELHSLDWLEYIFPIAEIGEDDEMSTYPTIYREDGTFEYAALLPDDEVKAYSWFMDNGFDIGLDGELNIYQLTLYVWAKLDNISANTNDFTMTLVNDVLGKLRDSECYNISINTKSPFTEFTAFQNHENAFLKRKRTGFRVDFTINGDNNTCQNSIDVYGNYGSKSSAVDKGKRGQVSFDDDYCYVCTHSGVAGEAVWKKFPLMKT